MSRRALLDSDVFISYLFQEDELYEPSRNLVRTIARGDLIARVSSELYDDIISALRGSGLSLSDVINVLRDVSNTQGPSHQSCSIAGSRALQKAWWIQKASLF
jgi:predicted nucleic acid-binding protein